MSGDEGRSTDRIDAAGLSRQVVRDDQGVAHVLGLSGGKDSTALALAMAERHPEVPMNYICTPTGNELPEMEAHWRKCEELTGRPLLRLTAPDGAGGVLTLEKLIRRFEALPNDRMRWCTRMLKIEPTRAFMLRLLADGPAVLYVGLRADEEARQGLFWEGETRFPMREWGWGEADVWAYLDRRGVKIPRRTDCAWCYHQRLIEWKVLAEDHPDLYQQAIELEDWVSDRRGRMHTFRNASRDTWPADLRSLRDEFLRGRKVRGEKAYRERIAEGRSPCRVCSL